MMSRLCGSRLMFLDLDICVPFIVSCKDTTRSFDVCLTMTILFVELKAIEEIVPKHFLTAKCSVTEHSQEIQGFLLERCVRDPIIPVVHQ